MIICINALKLPLEASTVRNCSVIKDLCSLFHRSACCQAYSAALQTQWQWVNQLCVCVEQHLKDNTAYFQVRRLTRHKYHYRN